MKLSYLIYDIKNTVNMGASSIESKISEKQIEYWINIYRARMIAEAFEKSLVINSSYVQSLGCIELECAPRIECEEFNLGYNFIFSRTKQKLPLFVNLDGNYLVTYVGLADGITPIEFTDKAKAINGLNSRWTKFKKRAFLHNDYLYVTNAKDLKKIYISGIFQNPREVINFITNEDPEDFEYPINYSDIEYIKKKIFDFDIKYLISGTKDDILDLKDNNLTVINNGKKR